MRKACRWLWAPLPGSVSLQFNFSRSQVAPAAPSPSSHCSLCPDLGTLLTALPAGRTLLPGPRSPPSPPRPPAQRPPARCSCEARLPFPTASRSISPRRPAPPPWINRGAPHPPPPPPPTPAAPHHELERLLLQDGLGRVHRPAGPGRGRPPAQ